MEYERVMLAPNPRREPGYAVGGGWVLVKAAIPRWDVEYVWEEFAGGDL